MPVFFVRYLAVKRLLARLGAFFGCLCRRGVGFFAWAGDGVRFSKIRRGTSRFFFENTVKIRLTVKARALHHTHHIQLAIVCE